MPLFSLKKENFKVTIKKIKDTLLLISVLKNYLQHPEAIQITPPLCVCFIRLIDDQYASSKKTSHDMLEHKPSIKWQRLENKDKTSD